MLRGHLPDDPPRKTPRLRCLPPSLPLPIPIRSFIYFILHNYDDAVNARHFSVLAPRLRVC